MRESSTDDEPACLHPGDELDVAMAGRHVGDDRSERRGVGQQRGDVLEEDTRCREVRDVAQSSHDELGDSSAHRRDFGVRLGWLRGPVWPVWPA